MCLFWQRLVKSTRKISRKFVLRWYFKLRVFVFFWYACSVSMSSQFQWWTCTIRFWFSFFLWNCQISVFWIFVAWALSLWDFPFCLLLILHYCTIRHHQFKCVKVSKWRISILSFFRSCWRRLDRNGPIGRWRFFTASSVWTLSRSRSLCWVRFCQTC